MKKSLLAIAVLGAFSGIASAQSSITIYGVADVGFTNENNGSTSVTRMDSGILNGSRLGFKGTENLGGGLSAIFDIQMGYSIDTGVSGQGALFGRQSLLGLQGGFGTVTFGRQYTPIYQNSPTYDPFVDALAGDTSRLFNYGGVRLNNSIVYSYATNGFTGTLQYGLGEVAGNASAGSAFTASGRYANGPIDVVLTYDNTKDTTGNVSGKSTLLGGNYNFGPVKLYATYQWNNDSTASATGAPVAGAKENVGLVGLTAPLGKGTLKFSYIKLTDKTNANADANQIALGYVYDLSKRTALYTSVGRLANDSNAKYASGINGATDRLFNVGIRHFF